MCDNNHCLCMLHRDSWNDHDDNQDDPAFLDDKETFFFLGNSVT